jgi:ABC-type multidrug transport system ATPase subunit
MAQRDPYLPPGEEPGESSAAGVAATTTHNTTGVSALEFGSGAEQHDTTTGTYLDYQNTAPLSTSAEIPNGTATPKSSDSDMDSISISEDNSTVVAPIRNHNTFEPVRAGDRDELYKIASRVPTNYSSHSVAQPGSTLERRDTYADLAPGDPELDPKSDRFDAYKWARVMTRLWNEKGVRHRSAGFMFKNLRVTGTGSSLQYQHTVLSILTSVFRFRETFGKGRERVILNHFDGVVRAGELLIVLGRPGSGCSTFLKTITGETRGLYVDPQTVISYDGIPQKTMVKDFKGELVYNQEVDKHFPHLTVGETLEFAAKVRTSQASATDLPREERAKHLAAVMMAVFGLSHTYNTKVGNDFVRGVSGGERKRVSIAEMALAMAPIGAWDNSTRGLDAATALEFTKALKMSSNLTGSTFALAIYQASQAIYDEFDKAVVLYEGRQIYFGPTKEARQYFIDMGYECPPRQTTGDFLTSVTNVIERKPRQGYEDKVPRTPDDFEKYWHSSPQYARLQKEIEEHEREFPFGKSPKLDEFFESRQAMQANHMRKESPYTVSIPMQVKYCTQRAYQRLWNDKASTITAVFGQTVMALIIGSIFYNTPNDTNSFFQKGGVIFFAVLLNALMVCISPIPS